MIRKNFDLGPKEYDYPSSGGKSPSGKVGGVRKPESTAVRVLDVTITTKRKGTSFLVPHDKVAAGRSGDIRFNQSQARKNGEPFRVLEAELEKLQERTDRLPRPTRERVPGRDKTPNTPQVSVKRTYATSDATYHTKETNNSAKEGKSTIVAQCTDPVLRSQSKEYRRGGSVRR